MPTPPKATSQSPTTTDQSWLQHVQTEIQKEPERLENTAKFLVGIISISLTIFISNRPEGLAEWSKAWMLYATVLWIISALLSFFVLFPWRYAFNPDSATDIQRAYRQIATTKRKLLILSLSCLLLALGLASCTIMA